MEQDPLAPLSKATGISAQPNKPLPFTIIDFLSGGLTDPEGWRFDSREENGMKVAQALTALLGAKIPRSTNTNMRNFDRNVPPVDMTLNTRKFLPPQKVNLPAEFTPVGEEEIYNQTMQHMMPPVKGPDDFYDFLLRKFGQGFSQAGQHRIR